MGHSLNLNIVWLLNWTKNKSERENVFSCSKIARKKSKCNTHLPLNNRICVRKGFPWVQRPMYNTLYNIKTRARFSWTRLFITVVTIKGKGSFPLIAKPNSQTLCEDIHPSQNLKALAASSSSPSGHIIRWILGAKNKGKIICNSPL